MLFGSTNGFAISGRDLGTRECLDTILASEAANRDAIHVGFATEYDVNMILRDLNWRALAMLYDAGMTKWEGYRIKHTPGKLFRVSKGGVTATIYNVFGFFHSSYIRALEKYKIGTEEQRERIKAGKDQRSGFTFSKLASVERYWAEELSLLPPLMDKLRDAAYSAGFFITEWHGPGALASYALKQNKAGQYRSRNVPAPVKLARALAYAGGRFQAWRAGLYLGPIYTADINSAYAYAAAIMPRLDNGSWHARNPTEIRSPKDIARFGLYRIRFDLGEEATRKAREWGLPFPLFHRGKAGHLTWPALVEGWYWSPEAATVAGSPYAKFLEVWEFEDDGTTPFAWIGDAYNRRLRLQDTGHPAEKAYKWMLAAMYGQWAQRVGWDKERRTPPRSHELERAGFITSMCRSLVQRAALPIARQGGLVSIDTDGVVSTKPFKVSELPGGVGNGLGQWKVETYTGILYWQNGIYWLRDEDGNWIEPKTRGIPRGRLSIEAAFETMVGSQDFQRMECAGIEIQRDHFVGYGQALQHQYDSWRHWKQQTTKVLFGGTGKGMHVPGLCAKCSVCGSVPLHTITHFPPESLQSEPHKLPWLSPVREEKNAVDLIWKDDEW